MFYTVTSILSNCLHLKVELGQASFFGKGHDVLVQFGFAVRGGWATVTDIKWVLKGWHPSGSWDAHYTLQW